MTKVDPILHRCRAGVLTTIVLLVVVSTWSQAVLAQDVRRPSRRLMPQITAVSTPEEQGMDSTTLAAGIDFLLENRETYRVHSVVVIRNDHVVLDARFYPFSSEWRHDIASVTKSFTSTLVGIAIDNVNRFSPGRYGVVTASRGGWVSDNHFSATMDELGLINLWQWDLTFEGDTVTMTLESLAGGELPATATGTLAR